MVAQEEKRERPWTGKMYTTRPPRLHSSRVQAPTPPSSAPTSSAVPPRPVSAPSARRLAEEILAGARTVLPGSLAERAGRVEVGITMGARDEAMRRRDEGMACRGSAVEREGNEGTVAALEAGETAMVAMGR